MKTTFLFLLGSAFCWGLSSCTAQQPKPEEVIEVINRVNNYWQETHPQHGRSFWDNAAYHTGNMEVFFLTGNPLYLEKLHEYWAYANSIMYDVEEGLYYRDGKYVYPKHKSVNGKKDFWVMPMQSLQIWRESPSHCFCRRMGNRASMETLSIRMVFSTFSIRRKDMEMV